MSTDNNRYTGAFGDFSSGSFSEPKNITSDMWTPISVSSDSPASDYNRRYTPNDSFSSANQNGRGQSRPPQNRERSANPRSQGERPISQGRTPESRNASRSGQKKATSQGQPPRGKGSTPSSSQRPQQQRPQQQRPPEQRGNQSRPPQDRQKAPQARNQRSTPSHAKPPVSQREKQMQRQNKRDVYRSNEQYDKRRSEGESHNEILNKNSAKKQKNKKIRAIISISVVAVVVALLIGVYTYYNGALVQKVVIEGDTIYTDKQIIYVSGIKTGDNMLGISKKQVAELVRTKLPYISEAQVDFSLPDTVTITVAPTTDRIFINNQSNYICLDDNDKIVSLKKKKLSPGLYRVDGFEVETVTQGTTYEPSEANVPRFEVVKKIVTALRDSSMEKAAIITVSDLNDVQLIYDSRIRVYLGKCDDLQAQLSLAIVTIKHSVTETQRGYIDMRYSNTAYFNEGSMDAK